MRKSIEQLVEDSTLCWKCKKSGGKCEWSAFLKPVPGWEAIPTLISEEIPSYQVVRCPKYEFDKQDCKNCIFKNAYGLGDMRRRCANCCYNPKNKGVGADFKDTDEIYVDEDIF